jgi:MFS family permease
MNPYRSLAGLPRESWVLFGATLVNRAGSMAIPFLMLFLTRERGLDPRDAGLVVALYGVGAIVSAPAGGRLVDRLGALAVLRGSLLLGGAALLLFPFVHGLPALVAATLLWSLLGEAFRPASLAMVSDLVGPEKRRAAFAANRLAVNLGMSVGPALGGFIAERSFRWVFLVDGLTALVAGLILIAAPWRMAPGNVERTPAGASPSGWRDRRLLFFLAALAPAIVVFFQDAFTLPIFLVRDLGLAMSQYGLLFTINTVLIVLFEVPLNGAMAGWPHRRSLALGALLVGTGFGALAFARDFAGVAATVVVWTVGEMVLLPTASAFVADLAPTGRSGDYMGMYTMLFGLVFVLAPWAGTQVLERWGAATLWAACFAAGCVSAALLARVYCEPRAPATAGGAQRR